MLKVTKSLDEFMKKRAGFTIIEVLIALFMFVSATSVFFNLQVRSVRRVLRDRGLVERVYLARKEWMQAFINPPEDDKKQKRDVADPAMQVVTEQTEQKRSLARNIEEKQGEKEQNKLSIRLVKTEASWEGGQRKESLVIAGVRYHQPAEEEHKK